MDKTDFPIFKTYPSLVYLDNAATSQKPVQVISAIQDYYASSNANVHRGIYSLSEKATQEYEKARTTVAQFLNAQHNEIIFTSGTTDSINLLANSLFDYFTGQRDKTILLTESEHHSNILPWQLLATRLGWKIEYVKITSEFDIDVNDLQDKLSTLDVAVFAYSQSSNVLGTIVNMSDINKLVRELSENTVIVVDGAQYIPHKSVDLSDQYSPDFYAFSGHKMLGPTGIGVLFGKENWLEKVTPSKQGGGMIEKVNRTSATFTKPPIKFEAGTPNIAGAIGLNAAIDYINNIDHNQLDHDMTQLTDYFLEKLIEIPEMKLFGKTESKNRLPVFSFEVQNIHPHDIAQLLDTHNIAIRAGHHCTQILHREVLNSSASSRVSLYIYNDKKDIDKFFEAIKIVISTFKR